MRVAIVSPDPVSQAGGVERYCWLLASALAAHGLEPNVVAWPLQGGGDHFDVVITNGMTGGRTTKPRIHVAHGTWVPHMLRGDRESSVPWRVKRTAQGAVRELRAGRGVPRVAVSEATSREWAAWYGLRRATVIVNPVDTSLFRPGDRASARRTVGWAYDERIALFVGRPEPRKRPDWAVRAAMDQGYRLVHAGSPALTGAEPLGVVPPDRLALLYTAVDCVLSPSRYEGCSLAVLEALACGTPVISTSAGWIRDLVQGVPGYARLVGDTLPAFVDALGRLAGSSCAVTSASAQVRREHSLEVFGRRWVEVLERALGGRQTEHRSVRLALDPSLPSPA